MANNTTPKRLNPEQVFIIMSVTRGEICREVNELIENEEWDVPKLEPDDPRLDDEFCQDFADQTAETFSDVDETHDREYQRQRAVAAGHFDIEVDDDS
jgi:hypothetical protein